MANAPRKNPPPSKDPTEPEATPMRGKLVWGLIFFSVVALIALTLFQRNPTAKVVPYSELKQHISQGHVEKVIIHQDAYIDALPTSDHKKELEATEGEKKTPSIAPLEVDRWRAVRLPEEDNTLVPLLDSQKVAYEFRTGCDEGGMLWLWLLPMVLLFFFYSFMLRRVSGGIEGGPGSPAMDFGKSRAKMYVEEGTGVTFQDVAGCEEAKEELLEVVDFLREPERISRLGGKVPKGVLLVGPPGTGKTLLARAVAGEAGVPFFNLSGSDFVEMFVGVGAARVRDLFKQATEHAPCIIFVDELDAIGKSRAGNQIQTNDEREQTLNALLVEMDGFDARSGVILLAATNRPEILDRALLRPGRFDRQVLVDRPDVRGRTAILNVHARRIVMNDEVDLELVAAQTPGFVGADLANVVNEAALLGARRGKDSVEMDDFQEAIERVIAGLEKKSRRLSEKEKNIVAYHESGHAIVAAAVENADPVHKVSIVSRGMGALGYTLQVPLEDRYLMTRQELLDRIAILLGGRAAEQIIFGDVSTGASNDLQRVTSIARGMVAEYGMSQVIGQVQHTSRSENSFLGDALSQRPYSDETALLIDKEVRQMVEEIYAMTLFILETNVDLLHEMSERLKKDEVLDGEPLQAMLDRVLAIDKENVPERDGTP
ncbi:MAG: ATP-dependent zinc metalloprotease FtsH [Myxococcota bacterium]|nr:ATP-dependent zinc metalloprotease FtsH [Myxococcota bacterium]